MRYSELEQLYKDAPIADIEQVALDAQAASVEAQRKFIGALFYLERTNRYKENPQYKSSDFAGYLRDRFDLAYIKYNNMRTAFFHFATEVEEFGWARTLQVVTKLGVDRAERAFPKIRAAVSKRKTPMSPSDFQDTVNRLAPPKENPVPTKTIRDWERAYHEEHRLRLALEDENRELKQQVARLKATVAERVAPPTRRPAGVGAVC